MAVGKTLHVGGVVRDQMREFEALEQENAGLRLRNEELTSEVNDLRELLAYARQDGAAPDEELERRIRAHLGVDGA